MQISPFLDQLVFDKGAKYMMLCTIYL